MEEIQYRRYFLRLSYDGTNFCGWQFQKNNESVQESIEKVLKIDTLKSETTWSRVCEVCNVKKIVFNPDDPNSAIIKTQHEFFYYMVERMLGIDKYITHKVDNYEISATSPFPSLPLKISDYIKDISTHPINIVEEVIEDAFFSSKKAKK